MIALLGLFLTACGSLPRVAVVASAAPTPITDELECMAECLEGPDSTCDGCADRCLERSTSPVVATLGRL